MNDLEVRPRVWRQASDSERAATGQSHRQQELVGHVFAHGQPGGEIGADLFHHPICHRLRSDAALAETGKNFGVSL